MFRFSIYFKAYEHEGYIKLAHLPAFRVNAFRLQLHRRPIVRDVRYVCIVHLERRGAAKDETCFPDGVGNALLEYTRLMVHWANLVARASVVNA